MNFQGRPEFARMSAVLSGCRQGRLDFYSAVGISTGPARCQEGHPKSCRAVDSDVRGSTATSEGIATSPWALGRRQGVRASWNRVRYDHLSLYTSSGVPRVLVGVVASVWASLRRCGRRCVDVGVVTSSWASVHYHGRWHVIMGICTSMWASVALGIVDRWCERVKMLVCSIRDGTMVMTIKISHFGQ